MLKPALARGELRCIGATTLNEYRKYIEKDAALERRFQPVMVGEPTVEDTIAILRGLKERYEIHHGVRIKDAAIVAAAMLSHRYIADRFLPDKAIDLIDEAASRCASQIDPCRSRSTRSSAASCSSRSSGRRSARRKIRQSHERLQQIEKRTGRLSEKIRRAEGALEAEKEAIGNMRKLKEQIEQAASRGEQAQRAGELAKAARDSATANCRELERELDAAEEELAKVQKDGARCSRKKSTKRTSRESSAKWTGIPVSTNAGRRERRSWCRWRSGCRTRDRAGRGGRTVANAIRRNRAGLERSEPADRQVHLPRSDRRRQDRTGASAGGISVRRR